jgi:hypothetical protein
VCERALWSAVVLQALEDVSSAPIDSTAYNAACSFFTAPGEWSQQRQWIGDALGLHGDDIKRTGRRYIAARESNRPPPAAAVVLDPWAVVSRQSPVLRAGSWRKNRSVVAAS